MVGTAGYGSGTALSGPVAREGDGGKPAVRCQERCTLGSVRCVSRTAEQPSVSGACCSFNQ